MPPMPRCRSSRPPAQGGPVVALITVVAGALLLAGCSSASVATGSGAGSTSPPGSSVRSDATARSDAAAPTNDDALNPFDGTWTKQFAPVACALDDGESTTTAAPSTTAVWDLPSHCAAAKPAGPKAVFYWAGSLTIDGSTITVDFPTDPSCVGALHASGMTPQGDTEVVIDHITCGGQPAPDVTTTLRVDGDVLIADGERIARKGTRDPGGSGPSTTGFTRVAPAIS